MRALYVLSLCSYLAGCGVEANFSDPGVYQCSNGRTIRTDEWQQAA